MPWLACGCLRWGVTCAAGARPPNLSADRRLIASCGGLLARCTFFDMRCDDERPSTAMTSVPLEPLMPLARDGGPRAIGICGSYGGLNLGDEAILTVALEQLRIAIPGVEL